MRFIKSKIRLNKQPETEINVIETLVMSLIDILKLMEINIEQKLLHL